MRLLIVMTALLCAAGCTLSDLVNRPTPNTLITMDREENDIPVEGVIFIAENAAQAGLNYEFNETIIDYWTPTAEQAATLEVSLPDFLDSSVEDVPRAQDIFDDMSRYRRQYFGITFEGGSPLIYANYFCDSGSDFPDWQERYIMVMDGGACFFQVLYDPATGTFSNLRINGEA